MNSIDTISPDALADLARRSPITILDVRTPMEFEQLHVVDAINVPVDQLDPAKVPSPKSGTLYVICRSGSRGRKACDMIRGSNPKFDVVNIEGGTLAWEGAGLPVVRGRKRVSLERQVRITAGSLVAIGSALGAFVHPAFIGLAAFVGLGLVFSGITDTCGMGLLLAKMPWNRTRSACSILQAGG